MVVRKSMRGTWEAVTDYPLAEDRQLSIRTFKPYRNRIITTATVYAIKGDIREHAMYRDFTQLVEQWEGTATRSAIEKQHQHATKDTRTLMQCVAAHYQP